MHAALYGARREVKFYARAGMPGPEVQRRYLEWRSEIEGRIVTLRKQARGEGRDLTHRETHALAGEWYRWFVAQFEDDPGDPLGWEVAEDLLDEARYKHLPQDIHPEDIARFTASHDRTRRHMRAIVADHGRVSTFMCEKRIVLSHEARDRFLDCLEDDYVGAVQVLRRRAEGDYGHDGRLGRFPKTGPKNGAGMTCWQAFEAWVAERQPKPATADRWRGVFLNLQAYFRDRDIATITDAEAVAWKDTLLTPKRSGQTVNEVWLNAARTVFNWTLANKKLKANPFVGIRAACAAKPQHRESRAFTQEERTKILSATLEAHPRVSRAYRNARRWVPWLQAYTGARVQEMTQLRAQDVIEQDGISAIRITPEAGTTKTNTPRTVPIHEHLIEQGFLSFVQDNGAGPLFYDARAQRRQKVSDPTNPQKPLAVKAREHLARWVRSIGIDDPELSPTHSWRHTFKDICDGCGIREKVSDAITGHVPVCPSSRSLRHVCGSRSGGFGSPSLLI